MDHQTYTITFNVSGNVVKMGQELAKLAETVARLAPRAGSEVTVSVESGRDCGRYTISSEWVALSGNVGSEWTVDMVSLDAVPKSEFDVYIVLDTMRLKGFKVDFKGDLILEVFKVLGDSVDRVVYGYSTLTLVKEKIVVTIPIEVFFENASQIRTILEKLSSTGKPFSITYDGDGHLIAVNPRGEVLRFRLLREGIPIKNQHFSKKESSNYEPCLV